MYQCFHCGQFAVGWSGDFDAEEYGYEEPGIVHECQCANCGAQITYVVLDSAQKEAQKAAQGQDTQAQGQDTQGQGVQGVYTPVAGPDR